MKNTGKIFSLWTKYGALNSKPVFDAFAQGAARLGHTCRENAYSSDVDVIWSVLWRGRMQGNLTVWNRAKQKNKNVSRRSLFVGLSLSRILVGFPLQSLYIPGWTPGRRSWSSPDIQI